LKIISLPCCIPFSKNLQKKTVKKDYSNSLKPTFSRFVLLPAAAAAKEKSMEKLLLSENVKRFMDYAVDTLNSMDGAPNHDEQEKAEVLNRISILKDYLNDVEQSYLENAPGDRSEPVDPGYIAEVGHS
jgi:hypothetical protein